MKEEDEIKLATVLRTLFDGGIQISTLDREPEHPIDGVVAEPWNRKGYPQIRLTIEIPDLTVSDAVHLTPREDAKKLVQRLQGSLSTQIEGLEEIRASLAALVESLERPEDALTVEILGSLAFL